LITSLGIMDASTVYLAERMLQFGCLRVTKNQTEEYEDTYNAKNPKSCITIGTTGVVDAKSKK